MSNTTDCPICGTTAASDIAHLKTCVNDKCDINGDTFLHHEWIDLHEEFGKPLNVKNEINRLMAEF